MIEEFKFDIVYCYIGNGVKIWMYVSEKFNFKILILVLLYGFDVNSEFLIRVKYRVVFKNVGIKDFIKWIVFFEFLKCKIVENLDVFSEKIIVVYNFFNFIFLLIK